MSGWMGVDLDGTLAHYDGWHGPEHIGDPIPTMLDRVRGWLVEGKRVKIFTARATVPTYVPPITAWLEAHDLSGLEVTCIKDFEMIELWDDRCVQVIPNTGVPVLMEGL